MVFRHVLFIFHKPRKNDKISAHLSTLPRRRGEFEKRPLFRFIGATMRNKTGIAVDSLDGFCFFGESGGSTHRKCFLHFSIFTRNKVIANYANYPRRLGGYIFNLLKK
jgi:hypothetical protein